MILRMAQRMRTALIVLTCLAAVPVWAGGRDSYSQTFFAHLDGVNYRGNLRWDLGSDAEFNAVINTRTGRFNGTSKGWVTNQSRCYQLSFDVGTIYGLDIRHSLYEVNWNGRAFLLATGNAFVAP